MRSIPTLSSLSQHLLLCNQNLLFLRLRWVQKIIQLVNTNNKIIIKKYHIFFSYFLLQRRKACFEWTSKSLAIASPFCCLGFTSFMQTGMFLPHAANGYANAKSGEKKKRREVKFCHKGKKEIQIKFPAIPGS